MRDLKHSTEYLTIGGLSASTDDFNLFVASLIALTHSTAFWVYLVWIGTDPGAVRSRNEDFDMVSRVSDCNERSSAEHLETISFTLRLIWLIVMFLSDNGAVVAECGTPL